MRMRLSIKLLLFFLIFCSIAEAQEGWVVRNSGTNEDLTDVIMVSQNVGWAVGGSRDTPYKGIILNTKDGGASWEKQKEITNSFLRGLHFINDQIGWAVGYQGLVLKTVDGGSSWTAQSSGASEQFFAVFFLNEDLGWAVGTRALIVHTTDGGDTWVEQPNPYTGTRKKFRSVQFVDSQTGWVVGHDRVILKTTDGGNSWGTQFYERYDEDLRKIVFLDSQIGWAIGERGIILKTTSGGNSWTHQNSRTDEDLWGGVFVNQNVGWAVGDNGVVIRTTNGGTNWLSQKNSDNALLNAVYFIDENHGLAVGDGGTIISTTSGGVHGDDVPQNNPPEIISQSAMDALEGQVFTYTAHAVDPDGDAIHYTFQDIPSWALVSDSVLSGTVPLGYPSFSFRVIASDGDLSDEMTVQVTVIRLNTPPVVVSDDTVHTTEGEWFSYTARAHDPDGDPLTFSFTDFPVWLTPADSTIYGEVPVGAQDTSMVVHVSDGYDSDSLKVIIRIESVNNPPRFLSPDLVSALEGRIFKYTAHAEDPDGDAIHYTFQDIPSWALVSDSVLSGTVPLGYPSFSFRVIASDGDLSDEMTVQVTVIRLNTPPVVVSDDTVHTTEGEWFSYTARAHDPDGDPLTFSFTDFPVWLTPADSTIYGEVPVGAQDTSMVVHVSDGYDSDSLKVIIRIESVNNPPRFLSPDFVSMLEGSDFMYTAHAVDPEGERISYNFQHVPYWISVNDSILTGTAPFITEPHRVDSFFVTASDGMHQITMKVTLNITKDQMGPRIVNISDITFSNNETYAIDLDTCVVDTTYISRQMTWDIIPKSPYLIIQLSKRFVTLRSGLWTGSALLEFKVANPAQKADSLTVTVTITSSTSVPEESIVPNTLTLKPNFPNPFNSATSIHYELPSAARVVLDVLNIRGVVEQTLIQKNQKEGPHSVIWDATDHPAGTYFIRLRAGNEIRIQKCIYLK